MARSSKKEFRWKKMEHVTPPILRRILNSNAVSNAVDDWSPFALSNFLQHPTKRQILRDFIRFNKAQSAELSEDSSSDSDSDGDSDDSSMMLKTAQDRHIVRSFPTLLAHKQKKAFSKRRQLRLAMNLYQKQSRDDIVEMNHFEKKQGKWNVLGLVDPNKHLSTLDHSLNLKSWASPRLGLSPKMDIVNYHHWIPSVFRSNAEGTDCQLLSEIPNLDPYRYGDTVYPLITDLFLHQLPQFENVLGLDLRNRALKVVVKVQDYSIGFSDCNLSKEEDSSFVGNFHKEGLHEDIAAVGLYYYHVDEGIKGGELEISSLIGGKRGGSRLQKCSVRISEGLSLVFSNDLCYHKVCKLHGNGSRKMIAFFLLRDGANHSLSAQDVVVNWEYHSKHFVESNLRQILSADEYGAQGNEWMIQLIQKYVVGDRKYVERAMDINRRCRLVQAQQAQTDQAELTAFLPFPVASGS